MAGIAVTTISGSANSLLHTVIGLDELTVAVRELTAQLKAACDLMAVRATD